MRNDSFVSRLAYCHLEAFPSLSLRPSRSVLLRVAAKPRTDAEGRVDLADQLLTGHGASTRAIAALNKQCA